MAARLRERLARGEQPKVTLHAEVDTGWRQTPILEAEIDGPDADGPFILFSGHHDTWHYGVMDNGAANATMLEVARLAARERDKWRRGLRLCFWSGHSHGRYSGSTWYADQNWDELERRCAVHVNVDSTGGVGAVVLKNAAAAPELVALAGDAIGEQAGLGVCRQAHVALVRPVVLGHRHSRDVRRAQRAAAGAGEDAQRARLVVAHAARSAGQDRREEPGARHARLCAHAVAAADRSGAAAGFRRACRACCWRNLPRCVLSLGERCSVDSLIAAAETLRDKAAAGGHSDAALMRASRALAPVYYTSGDRFAHDPALPLPAWPVLDPLRKLAKMAPGTDSARFLTVSATRGRNRLAHALREAAEALGG